MQMSNTVEYALRAVVWIADRPHKPWTSAEIHRSTLVPPSYLSKVLRGLVAEGIVASQRGVHGGFVLAKPAENLSLLDVVNAVEPVQRIRECPLGLPNHGKNLCNLHRKLDEVMARTEEAFAACTVADLLQTPNASRPLCPLTVEKKAPRKAPGGAPAKASTP